MTDHQWFATWNYRDASGRKQEITMTFWDSARESYARTTAHTWWNRLGLDVPADFTICSLTAEPY